MLFVVSRGSEILAVSLAVLTWIKKNRGKRKREKEVQENLEETKRGGYRLSDAKVT